MRQRALETVHKLAKKDPRILFVGSDLGAGTLQSMKDELPNQFFMEGISEQHVIGFSAGLAQEGFIPFFNTIGTFLTRRAYEQIYIDIALHNLPVRLLAGGGGMVYAPLGPTHTAIEDFSLMLSIPGLQVFSPADAHEMETLIEASINDLRPYYIRFGKGGEKIVTSSFEIFDYAPRLFLTEGSKTILCTTGVMLQQCLDAQSLLAEQGESATIIHFPYLNDLEISNLLELFGKSKNIVCVEEHVPRGGLYTQLVHELVRHRLPTRNLSQISLLHSFSHNYGSQVDHLEFHGLTGWKIAMRVISILKEK